MLLPQLAGAAVDFVSEVQPVFQRHCYKCHGAQKQEAALRLDHKESALKGGDLGVAIVPGKAAESRLIQVVKGLDPKMKMPRKGDPLSAGEIALLERWINEGAEWPASASVTLSMKHGGWNSDDLQTMNLGRYRISATDDAKAEADSLPPKLRAWIEKGEVEDEDRERALFAHFRRTVSDWKAINDEIETLWKDHPEGTTTLVLDQREEPRMASVLKRGDFLKPGDAVQAGVPSMLHSLPKEADSTRLTFAKWLTDPSSPTTARTMVNRVWQACFGTGLIGTPEDLGTQGEAPSHPELLDWLSAEFMQPSDGKSKPWSLKHLHRLIVGSATYRQSSHVTSALLEKDPFNRLLSRGPRFRVEGEVVRDIQLAVSGLLNPQMGGRPVMPPAPAHLFEKPASYALFPWKDDTDAQKYRRGVYTFRRRITPYPFLSTFDVPNGETACVKRARSNTPMQALMTLNETLSLEASEALGQRVEKDGIAAGFELCTARQPSEHELAALTDLLKREQQRTKPDALKPMTVVARVILNLDESITKE